MPLGIHTFCMNDRCGRPIPDQVIGRFTFDSWDERDKEERLDKLWRRLRLEKRMPISISWSPVVERVRVPHSPERKLKTRLTKWKNKLKKRYPLFADEFFEEKKMELMGQSK